MRIPWLKQSSMDGNIEVIDAIMYFSRKRFSLSDPTVHFSRKHFLS